MQILDHCDDLCHRDPPGLGSGRGRIQRSPRKFYRHGISAAMRLAYVERVSFRVLATPKQRGGPSDIQPLVATSGTDVHPHFPASLAETDGVGGLLPTITKFCFVGHKKRRQMGGAAPHCLLFLRQDLTFAGPGYSSAGSILSSTIQTTWPLTCRPPARFSACNT